MKKSLLYLNDGTELGKLFIPIKANLFGQLSKYFPIIESDFEIESFESKFNFYEVVLILLYKNLSEKKESILPDNLYVPKELFYRSFTFFGTDYRLIQGSDADYEILLLLDIKLFIVSTIRNENKITCKFINRKAEAYSSQK